MIIAKKIVGSVESGPLSRTQVSLIRFGNSQSWFLDIRKYIESERYSGPTRQGISLHPETANEVHTLFMEGMMILNDNPDEFQGQIETEKGELPLESATKKDCGD